MASSAIAKQEKKDLKRKLAEKSSELRKHSALPAWVSPVVAAPAAYGAAYLDGRYGSPTNQHAASIGTVAAAGVGAVVATVMDKPTAGHVLADVAGGALAWLSGNKGYQDGQAARAKGGAAAG